MSMRGVEKCSSSTITEAFTGCFHEDRSLRQDFLLRMLASKGAAGGGLASAAAAILIDPRHSAADGSSAAAARKSSSVLDGLVIRPHATLENSASSTHSPPGEEASLKGATNAASANLI